MLHAEVCNKENSKKICAKCVDLLLILIRKVTEILSAAHPTTGMIDIESMCKLRQTVINTPPPRESPRGS